jgi:anion-transporting  ArsA/GET3 family ATPase
MAPAVMERRLIVVTGKGGVGKTTVAAALGLLGAHRGLRTIVVEVTAAQAEPRGSELQGLEAAGACGVGARGLAAALGRGEHPDLGVETELREELWGLTVDRDRVLAEWLRAVGGRVPARVLTASASFQYLVAAAPGAREMLSMIKVWELAEGRRPANRGRGTSASSTATRPATSTSRRPADRQRGGRATRKGDYDLVVLDAPATGHALAMLRAPRTYATIARGGPIARQAGQVRDLLEDPERSAYLAVTHPSEMAVTETLELREGLRCDVGRELDAVIVNATLPRRFERGELERMASLNGEGARESTPVLSAVRAAHAAHERARAQRSQIARLRRDAEPSGLPVVSVPFLFRPELDLNALEGVAVRLARWL